jgi:chromosome segregation ATPase
VLTTEQLIRSVQAERDYVDGQLDVIRERLRGIDTATRLLNETVNRTPTDIQKEITHLRELSDEKFHSVGTQFAERDTRQEREARDNKVAVDAAFAAQKEASSEQNKSNTLAINKSEVATGETINKLAELFKSTTDALAAQIADLKDRLTTIEQYRAGGVDNTNARRLDTAQLLSIIGTVILMVSVGVTILIATR